MEVKQGYSYHIRDEFFDLIQDKYLMSNKEGGNYRPHFLAIQESNLLPYYEKLEENIVSQVLGEFKEVLNDI